MTDLEKLLAYVQAAKKSAAIKGHSTDHDVNLFEMGKAVAYQDIENIINRKLGK